MKIIRITPTTIPILSLVQKGFWALELKKPKRKRMLNSNFLYIKKDFIRFVQYLGLEIHFWQQAL